MFGDKYQAQMSGEREQHMLISKANKLFCDIIN